MITSKNELYEWLIYEANLYNRKKINCPLFPIKSNDILYKYNFLLRKTEYFYNTNKKIMYYFYLFLLKMYQNKYFINVPINTFDKGLKFIHLGCRIVNSNSKIGKNCVLHANTFIVAGGTNDNVPKIGDNVIIGINSTVCGNAVIGDNVAIGANSFVNKDFSAGNMTIAGVPAKKISNKTKNDWNRDDLK